MFPDDSLPTPTNGGFENQEAFRQFVMEHQNGKWQTEFTARPTSDTEPDYNDDTLGDAFPLQFPYGHTGLRGDPAVTELNERPFRKRIDVFRKLLRHRKPCFHYPLFNLIVENMIMKDSIFLQTQMYCNVKSSETTAMGEKYGTMSPDKLEKAIQDTRQNRSIQYSNTAEHQFLRSIKSACGKLPHSNEACLEARRIYFSFLMKFGIPAVFLTITPDDLRNFRIVVYSLSPDKVSPYGEVDPKTLSESDILTDFNVRREARSQHPGLCAEEYQRIMELVIKHLFNWDTETQTSKGMGLFAELLAWCLATEEQGRKSLHGHFLLFLKNWNRVMNILQGVKDPDHRLGNWTYKNAARDAREMFANACSARLFSDFEIGKPLSECHIFSHDCLRKGRKAKEIRFSVKAVENQTLRDMRHKKLCHELDGQLVFCVRCDKFLGINGIIQNALNTHLGKDEIQFEFPENRCKPLDRIVYEMGKDFSWMDQSDYKQSMRYFVGNVITNVHLTKHAQRCFKKGPECYANLPDAVSESYKLVYMKEVDIWSNWCGLIQKRLMVRFQPQRRIEDAFMNVHNPVITKLLMCNNNVQVGMNGRSVLYSTGYQVKSQQKEERHAFEKVSDVLCKVIRKQVSSIKYLVRDENTKLTIYIFRQKLRKRFQSSKWDFVGFLLASIHTQVHILSALQWPIITPSTGRDSNFLTIIRTYRCMGWRES